MFTNQKKGTHHVLVFKKGTCAEAQQTTAALPNPTTTTMVAATTTYHATTTLSDTTAATTHAPTTRTVVGGAGEAGEVGEGVEAESTTPAATHHATTTLSDTTAATTHAPTTRTAVGGAGEAGEVGEGGAAESTTHPRVSASSARSTSIQMRSTVPATAAPSNPATQITTQIALKAEELSPAQGSPDSTAASPTNQWASDHRAGLNKVLQAANSAYASCQSWKRDNNSVDCARLKAEVAKAQ